MAMVTSNLRQLSSGSTDGITMGLSATDKISFFGQTTGTQPTTTTNVHTVAAGATTAVYTNTTFDGSIGSTAYTLGDVVRALKLLGLIAS